MWPLIKREAKDVILFAALPTLFVAIIIVYLAVDVHKRGYVGYKPYGFISNSIVETGWAPLIVIPSIAAFLGIYQIFWDRIRGVATFLATQATRRKYLLLAKIITALTCLITWLGSLTIVYLWANHKLTHLLPGGKVFIIHGMITSLLFALTTYTLGLLLAQYSHILISIFAAILMAGLVFFMLIVNGLNTQINILLAIIAIASLFLAWRRFMTVSL